MKAIIYDEYTDFFPTDEEIKTLCRPGQGADTCIWLTLGVKGFECVCWHRPHALLDSWMKGETNAKRNGCEKIQECPMDKEGEVEF